MQETGRLRRSRMQNEANSPDGGLGAGAPDRGPRQDDDSWLPPAHPGTPGTSLRPTVRNKANSPWEILSSKRLGRKGVRRNRPSTSGTRKNKANSPNGKLRSLATGRRAETCETKPIRAGQAEEQAVDGKGAMIVRPTRAVDAKQDAPRQTKPIPVHPVQAYLGAPPKRHRRTSQPEESEKRRGGSGANTPRLSSPFVSALFTPPPLPCASSFVGGIRKEPPTSGRLRRSLGMVGPSTPKVPLRPGPVSSSVRP